MKYRLVMYWLLSMLALCVCLWYPPGKHSTENLSPIDLTKTFKVEPSFFYFHDQRFHAVAGSRLRIELEKDRLGNNFTDYNTLVIEDLNISLNKTISLNWTVNNQHQFTPLNLGKQSVNRINFGTTQAAQIENLHLLITHNPELGANPSPQEEATFKAIYLSNGNPWSQFDVNLSEWLNFSPVKFNSINGYTSADNTHLGSLVLKVMSWLLVNVLLYLLLRVNGHHLIAAIMLGWLLVALPYWHTFLRQHQQLEAAFPENYRHLNAMDQSAFEVAQDIKTTLQNTPEINLSETKLVIVGPNDFIFLRLFYHLIDVDVAVYNNLYALKQASDNTVFVFFADSKVYCNDSLSYQWQYLGTDIINKHSIEPREPDIQWMISKPDYCLVKAP